MERKTYEKQEWEGRTPFPLLFFDILMYKPLSAYTSLNFLLVIFFNFQINFLYRERHLDASLIKG